MVYRVVVATRFYTMNKSHNDVQSKQSGAIAPAHFIVLCQSPASRPQVVASVAKFWHFGSVG
jgi:hypothetical protein